jgi:hypothetical protein
MAYEDIVTVGAKDGGSLALCNGDRALILKAVETADKWMDGSPITRREFERVLAAGGVEIVPPPPAARDSAGTREKDASRETEE